MSLYSDNGKLREPTEEDIREAKESLRPLLEFWNEGGEGPLPCPPPDDPEPPQFLTRLDPETKSFGPVDDNHRRYVKIPNPEHDSWLARQGRESEATSFLVLPGQRPACAGHGTADRSGLSVFAVAQNIERVVPASAKMEVRGNQILITLE